MSKWPDRLKLLDIDELKKKNKAILLSRALRYNERQAKEHAEKHGLLESVDEDELTESKSVSFLPPDTIAWMNKHRPLCGVTARQTHLTPAKALHFRAIFRGLDFDGSGTISLDEMAEAIEYVGKHEPECVQHPDEINKFFRSMDVDGNGAIDLGEFLMAMSMEESDENEKMQVAFFNFARTHRRKLLSDNLNNKSIEDSKKYRDFLHLFNVHEFSEKAPGSTEEQCRLYKIQAKLDKKNLGNKIIRLRKLELSRSNSALLNLSIEKVKDEALSIDRLIKDSNLPEDQEEKVSKQAQSLFVSKLTKFKLPKRDTYAPSLSTIRSTSSYPMTALQLVRNMKS